MRELNQDPDLEARNPRVERNERGYLIDRSSGKRVVLDKDGVVIPRTMSKVIDGTIPVSEMDDDELAKGNLKDVNGVFTAPPPRLLPKTVSDKRVREQMARVQEGFMAVALRATAVAIEVMDDATNSGSERLSAAKYVHERFLGKVPDKVELQAEVKPWEGLVGGILRTVGDEPEEVDPSTGEAVQDERFG